MQENQISRECFERSTSYRTRHDVLFQSFFWQNKNAKEERNLIQNATSKSI